MELAAGQSPPISMKGEICFDCYYPDDSDNIEGCYRLEGGEWQVFYVTRWYEGPPKVFTDAAWRSGITGVQVHHPKDQQLNILISKQVVADALGVTEWREVRGPDSLKLK
jgi:hypothetical protein